MFWALFIFSLGASAQGFETLDPAVKYDSSKVLAFAERLKSLPAGITNPETGTSIIENHYSSDSLYRGKIIRKLNPEGQWQIEVISVEFRFMRVAAVDQDLQLHSYNDCRYSRNWGEAYLFWRRGSGADSMNSRETFEAHLHPETESILSNCDIEKPAEFSHSIRNEDLNLNPSEVGSGKNDWVTLTTRIFQRKTESKQDSSESSKCIEYQRRLDQNFIVSRKCNPTDESADFWTDLTVLEHFR